MFSIGCSPGFSSGSLIIRLVLHMVRWCLSDFSIIIIAKFIVILRNLKQVVKSTIILGRNVQ